MTETQTEWKRPGGLVKAVEKESPEQQQIQGIIHDYYKGLPFPKATWADWWMTANPHGSGYSRYELLNMLFGGG